MILAVVPPNRCSKCHTTEASCEAKRNYQALPCCKACTHESENR